MNIGIDGKEHDIYYLYEPSGTLGPLVNEDCSTFTEAYGLFLLLVGN